MTRASSSRAGRPDQPATVPLLAPRPWLAWGVCLLLGAAVGIVGTVAHRSAPPWGLVAAFVALVAVGVVARATAGLGAVLAAGVGWMALVQVLSVAGPGGDVLVPATALGYVWVYGGVVGVLLAILAPRAWFADLPVGRARAARDR